MGLTIHYKLSLPEKTLLPEVRQKLGALRQCCLDLPFKEVGELMEFKGEECKFERLPREHPQRWFLCQADTFVNFKYGRGGKPVPVEGFENGTYSRSVCPQQIVGFSTWPGAGCEEANVGLSRFPKTVVIANKWTGKQHRLPVKHGGSFFWSSFCKTQYANSPECGGIENFLRCHLSVVAMLDAAKKIGFAVECNDEGAYWQKRDLKALVKEIGQWDAFIAAFGGALKDATEETGLTIEAPITERKDFEQLEAQGQSLLPPGVGEVLRNLVETTSKGALSA